MPDQDAVVVITRESSSMQGELDLVWEHLLPAMKDRPVPADCRAEATLKQRLSSLALLPPKAQPTSPLATRISSKNFQVEPNDAGVQNLSFDFSRGSCVFKLKDNKG